MTFIDSVPYWSNPLRPLTDSEQDEYIGGSPEVRRKWCEECQATVDRQMEGMRKYLAGAVSSPNVESGKPGDGARDQGQSVVQGKVHRAVGQD